MINVVTVHWKSAKWIDPQLRYLERNIDEPFRVWAALEGIDAREFAKFHFAEDLRGTHPDKLNALADIVFEHSDPDDILVFIDGDALPIRPIASWMARYSQIAWVVARMWSSLKLDFSEEPRCPEVPKATRCP